MSDKIVKIGDSVLQHGPFNDRVYLMKLAPHDIDDVPEAVEDIARENNYSKIFSKIPLSAKQEFLKRGHVEEANVPGFYNGVEDASFMGKFLSEERIQEQTPKEKASVLKSALAKFNAPKDVILSEDEEFVHCTEKDVNEMADLYSKVFPSYPFPIQNASYLLETMLENVVYFGIRKKGELVALASCEMDVENSNVEMTDFATLPELRGRGYSYYLLIKMEEEMRSRGVVTAYTIARSRSYGMNTVFSRNTYLYAGTLVNNTNISGNIESMNIWYKKL